MPKYSTEVDVDLDIEEILNECSQFEIDVVIGWLKERSKIPSGGNGYTVLCDNEFDKQVSKLIGNRIHLSKEDEDIILKITNTFY
jgi:hypothetical protein